MSVFTTYHRAFLAILVGAITIAFFIVMRGFLIAMMLAGIFTAIMYPAYRRVLRACRYRERLSSALMMVMIVVLVVIPFIAFIGLLVSQGLQVSTDAAPMIQEQIAHGHWAERLSRLPFADKIQPYQDELIKKGTEAAATLATFVVGKLSAITKGTVSFIVNLALMLYAMYFFFIDGPRLMRRIMEYLPLSPEDRTRLVDRFASVSIATLKSTVVIGLVQGLLGAAAFAVASIPGAVFWGTIMTVFAMIPGIGTALVWIPAAIYLAVNGRTVTVIVFSLYFILIVGTIDNILRPRLVGRGSQMHELLVLLSTLGGIIAFGMVGFILGPVIAALFLTLWDIQGESVRDTHDRPTDP
jgi:predicted PurR-regulated permease PerM